MPRVRFCKVERIFSLSKINTSQALNYVDLIDWEEEPCTEPPLTIDFEGDTIMAAFQGPLRVPPYPNHTQAVERMVRVVTEVATKRAGYAARHRCV